MTPSPSSTQKAPPLAASHERVQLPQVTLVAIDGRTRRFDIEMAHKALRYSQLGIDFGAVHLLTPVPPAHLDPSVEHKPIPELTSLASYSRFVLQSLHTYINTDYCLLVQADGFVLNPRAFQPAFLAYDYIGAPWPKTTAIRGGADYTIHDLSEAGRVGNGGFSLRSRRLLAACAAIDSTLFGSFPEDFVICRLLREYLLQRGFSFAPVELAAAFALELEVAEAPLDLRRPFGFHGRHFEPETLLMSL